MGYQNVAVILFIVSHETMGTKNTEYADRLLEDLDELDWPESIKTCNETGLDVQKVPK